MQNANPSPGKKRSSITEYNRKSYIIQNFLYFVVFIVIVTSISYPWISSRNAAKESISNIYSEHLTAHTEAITAGIQEFLKQYEVPPRFLAGITENPNLIECSTNKVYQFVRFCQAARKNLDPKPNVFFLGESQTSFCMINWNNSESTDPNDFYFYYAWHYFQDQFDLYEHQGNSTDFQNFQPTQGTNLQDFSTEMKMIFETSTYNSFLWHNIYYEYNSKALQNVLGGAVYIEKNSTDSVTISGIGLNFSSLLGTLQRLAAVSESKYAFLNMDDTVLFDDQGEFSPINITEKNIYQYPPISSLTDEFWSAASSILPQLKKGSIEQAPVAGKKYLFLMRNITVKESPQFRIIVAFNIEEPISNMFFDTTLIFVGSLGLVGLVFFITAFFMRRSKLERSRKLRRVPNLEDEKFKIDPNGGALVRSIHSLRKLQLASPEDTILNKIADNAILNLAQSRSALFQSPATKDGEFASILKKLSPPPDDGEIPFSMWRATTGERLISNFDPEAPLDWEKNLSDPRYFARNFMHFVISNDLLFKSVDPDSLVKFAVEVAISIGNPAHSALRLAALTHLLGGPLKNTIGKRIDTFCILLAVSLLQAVNAENICKRAKNIKQYLDLLESLSPGKCEEASYIREIVRQLLMAADDKHVFEVIGEFAVISESSEFNIVDNIDHHMIYMKALVKLCDFAPYWSPIEIMKQALEAEDSFVGAATGFKESYRYVVASKIVNPLLITFTNLIKMDDVSTSLSSNIEILKKDAEIYL